MVEAFNLFLAVHSGLCLSAGLSLSRADPAEALEAAGGGTAPPLRRGDLRPERSGSDRRTDPHSKTTELPHRPAGCLCGGGQLHR